jgi:predicted signal transduction protein with EAL and GGDEF domain
VSGSVGIALYPEDGRDAQTLMKNADTAMFHGKSLGKNTYQYFTAQMNIAVKRRMTLESALRRAVLQRDFVLHYQPQIASIGRDHARAVRWKTEDMAPSCRDHPLPRRPASSTRSANGCCARLPPGKGVADMGLPAAALGINLSARQFATALPRR